MSVYQKTAKDIAFDRERLKFRRQIKALEEKLQMADFSQRTDRACIDRQRELIKSLEEQNQKLKELIGLPEEDLQTILGDAKRTEKAAESIQALFEIKDVLKVY